MNERGKYTITYGGWYQRTTIHLSEIYYFLALGKSNLKLSEQKLQEYHKALNLAAVTREAGYLEYVKAITKEGVEIRYYEDGLYVLELKSNDIISARNILKDYYNKYFEPAVGYIFSLGAPTPKILANIKTIHPVVIGLSERGHDKFIVEANKFGAIYSKIVAKDVSVYKTPEYIFVVSEKSNSELVRELNEMQIFFREFKDHLEKYLDIHRTVWEDIAEIKRKREIRGNEIGKIRLKLDSYQKTVTLISRRINQMGTYGHTRASIAKNLEIEEYMLILFQYKFEVLSNTLDYIKEIWAMTQEYLDSAIKMIVELQSKSTDTGLKSLRLITTLGVVSGTIGYVSANRLPIFNFSSLVYGVILLTVTWVTDQIIIAVYKRVKYRFDTSKDVVKFK